MDVSQYLSFADELRATRNDAVKKARDATRLTAANITRDAKLAAPVDTGNLRSSIGFNLSRGNHIVAEIGPTANYGIYLELGTYKMAAQPYLFPATDRHVPAWEAALARIVTL